MRGSPAIKSGVQGQPCISCTRTTMASHEGIVTFHLSASVSLTCKTVVAHSLSYYNLSLFPCSLIGLSYSSIAVKRHYDHDQGNL